MKKLFKRNKLLFFLYLIVQIVATLTVVASIVLIFKEKDLSWESDSLFMLSQSVQLLLASFLPFIISKLSKSEVPDILSFLLLSFFIGAIVIGELFGIYEKSRWWDKALHITSGAILAIFGFSFLNLILPEKTWKSLNPIILALFAFGFATTIGVFWEIIEYSVDLITGSNMQRHTNSITGIPFEGQEALQDTMRDFMSNAIGALSFSIIGYFNLKKEKVFFL